MNNTCFVIMPFSPEFDGILKYAIRPAVSNMGDVCIRGDDIFSPGSVIDDIRNAIDNSHYIIADLSAPNPNVYYELGLTHQKGTRAILLTKTLETLPFDLRHQRVIVYEDTAAGAALLKNTIEQYISKL